MFRSGFFTSDSWTINGDGFAIGNKAEGSDFFAKIVSAMVPDGVPYLPTSNLQILATTGMILSVGAGFGFKDGYLAWETDDTTITCTSSASEQTLYISARLDTTTGEFTGGKVDKYTTFVADTDLCFAVVVIPANAVTITNAMITDVRSKATYCGFITDQREYLETLIAEIQQELTNIIGGGLPDHAATHETGGDDVIDIDACNGVQYVSQTLTASEQTQVRTNISAAKAVNGVLDAIEAAVGIDSYTENRIIALSNIGNDVWMTNAAARTITIPPQADVTFVDRSYFFATRGGTGAVTITEGAGVMINSAGSRLKIAEQYGTVMLRRTAENVWLLTGSTSA